MNIVHEGLQWGRTGNRSRGLANPARTRLRMGASVSEYLTRRLIATASRPHDEIHSALVLAPTS